MRTLICLALFPAMLACGQQPPPQTKQEKVYVYMGRADEFGAKGQWKEALDMMNIADSLQPGDMDILHMRGTVKGHMGDYTGAIADLDRSLGLCTAEKQCRILYLSRATIHKEAGHLDLACEDWKRVGALALDEVKKFCH